MVPDEILIEIFSYLDETDLIYCMPVCKDWNRVSHDLSLLYIGKEYTHTLSFEDLLLNCCQHNYVLSFNKAINRLNHIFPQINYHNLWSKCINIACQQGHFSLFKRLHNYAICNPQDLMKLAKDNNHLQIIKFLDLNYISYD